MPDGSSFPSLAGAEADCCVGYPLRTGLCPSLLNGTLGAEPCLPITPEFPGVGSFLHLH